MAITFTLTDLRSNNEFDMRPDPSSDPEIMLSLESLQMFSRDKQPVWHVGADGRQRLIQCHEGARGVSFTLIFRGSRDTAYNNLMRLNRWLELAIESELNPQNSYPIYLKVKLEGATNATIHRVQFGVTDPSSTILNPVTIASGVDAPLWEVGVALVLYPFGRSQLPYYLNNALHNGAFDRWNAAETEPYGWQATATGGTLAKATFKKLVGRFSCRVTTAANNEGLRADAVPVPAYHLAIASAWVIIGSGTWKLQIFRGTGAGTEMIALEDLTAAVLAANTGGVVQDTAVDEAGNTWYQIRVAQVTLHETQTMFVRWAQDGAGTGQSWIDAVQLRTVEAENRFQDPHFVHFDRNTWGDFMIRGGNAGFMTVAKTTTANFDSDGEFVTTASSLDVTFDTVTSSNVSIRTRVLNDSRQGDAWVCRFWMRFVSDGATTLRVQLRDGADNVLDTVDITEETIGDVDVLSDTGGDAATWYLIQLDGTNSSAPGVHAIWYPTATGSGTSMRFYLDELYIYSGTGPTFHGAFISDWRLENRNDFSDSAEEQYNYMHMFNLPGDGPCAIKLRGHVISGVDVARQLWIAAAPETRYPYIQHSYEAETTGGFTPNTDARWTDTADAAASGGNYNRFLSTSDSDTLGTGRDYIYMSIPDATILEEIHRWSGRPLRVFARARAEHSSGEMYFELATQNATVTRANRRQSFTAVNTWEWIDLGPLHLYYTEDGVRTTHNVSAVFRIYATANDTYHVDIDKVEFLPVPDGGYGRWRFYEFGTFGQYLLDGLNQEMTYVLDGTEIHTPYSGIYEFMPGHVAHMVIFGTAKATGEHSLTDIIDFTGVEIFPQTTHLLGTI